MAASTKEERIVVGQLAGVYGVKGWLKVRSFTQPAENILAYKPWFLRTPHGLKEMTVDEYKVRPQGVSVHFSGLDDRDIAAQLGRSTIEVGKHLLPDLADGDYYWHQLEGLTVLSDWNGEHHCLGIVERLMETGANDVLVVKPFESSIDDQERLIPYILEQFVTVVDLKAGLIRVVWDPEF